MPQFTSIKIDVEGKSIQQFKQVSVSQSIFEHHSFRLVVPTEAVDGTSGDVLHASKDMIGKSISIKVDAVGTSGSLQFAGVITQVEAVRHSGHAGDVIISGYSPTILLHSGPHCKSWESQTVKNIAQDVLSHFPQNLLNPKVSPVFSESLLYTAQYKETAWDFLIRLSARYGEWLYYDGQKLVLGTPQASKVKLNYGSDLHSFNMAVQVRPANFKMKAYDFENKEIYSGEPSGIADKAGLNDMGKLALQKSQKFYGTAPKNWDNQILTEKKTLDDHITTRASMDSSTMVRFNGGSGHPGIQLGGTVSVQGKNVFDQSEASIGDYTVVSVVHSVDGQGHYANDFVAIPASVKMPPVDTPTHAQAETQSAVVTDNNDPDGLGRVRVKFFWMGDSEKSAWVRIAAPHGGSGKGMFFLPEVGEEVIVGFEGGNADRPFIIGTVYNGKAKTTFGNSGNDVKALQTRSGNKIVMNDNAGSVHVADAKGNEILLDGGGNIQITAGESIVLTCGQSSITMKKDGTIDIKGNTITTTAQQKAVMTSGQATFTADGNQNEADVEGLTVSVSGNTKVEIGAPEIDVSGQAQVNISANAQLALKSTGLVAVKGAMITLN